MSIMNLLEYDHKHPADNGTRQEEKLFLYSLARLIGAGKIIEVGVRCGHSTAWLAEAAKCNAPDARVYAVDNWKQVSVGPAKARERLRDLGLLGYVHLVTDDSLHYLKQQPPLSADLLFIDGDHSYAAVMADLQEAFRISRKAIVAHDADNIKDVNQACKELGGGVHLPVNLGISTGMWLWVK